MPTLKKILNLFSKLVARISGPLPVGGMHITDFSVSYAGFRGKSFVHEVIRLQPGVVTDGRVKNKDVLSGVLREVRRRVMPDRRKSLSVVLSLPIRDVYIQTFSTPQVAEGDFDEAAELNARMISPIDVENAYYSCERISKGFTASADVDMLGAFVQKSIVDEFTGIIEAAGFGIAAVEFESMSLARSIGRAELVEPDSPYVIVQVAAEGMQFVIVRKGVPHFHYFHSWAEVQSDGKTVALDAFREAFVGELERVINFYFTHWSGEKLSDAVVITPAFNEEISSLLKERFTNLHPQIVSPSKINVVFGAAWRGVVSRSSDTDISLASLSALEVFERQQLISFAQIWRNVFATSLGFLLLLFVSSNILLRVQMSHLLESKGAVLSDPSAEEFAALTADAERFNALVAEVAGISESGVEPSKFLVKIQNLAGDDVRITRLSFEPASSRVLVNGTAPGDADAVAFKNRIDGESQFSDVKLPLKNIVAAGDRVSFSMEFKVGSFDFTE